MGDIGFMGISTLCVKALKHLHAEAHIFKAVWLEVFYFFYIWRILAKRPKHCDDVSGASPDQNSSCYKGGGWALSESDFGRECPHR